MIHILFGRHCYKAFVCINTVLITAQEGRYCWVFSYIPCSSAFCVLRILRLDGRHHLSSFLLGHFLLLHAGENGGEKNFNSLLVGVQRSRVAMSSVWRFLKNFKVLSYDPAVPLLSIYSEEDSCPAAEMRHIHESCCSHSDHQRG